MVTIEIVEIMSWLENLVSPPKEQWAFEFKKADKYTFSGFQPFYFILLSYMWNASIKEIDSMLFIIVFVWRSAAADKLDFR